MVNEFVNCTTNSSDGSFGCEKGPGPSNVLDKEAGDDDDDDDDGNDDVVVTMIVTVMMRRISRRIQRRS